MINWLKDNWWKALIVLFGPMIILDFMMDLPFVNSWSKADDSAWLGFWGGYLGSIVAVGGVFLQAKEELKNSKKLELEKARPIFLLNIMDGYEKNISGIANSNTSFPEPPLYLSRAFIKAIKLNDKEIQEILTEYSLPSIQIKNVSSNSMLAVNILLSWKDDKNNKEEFFIGRIEDDSAVSLITLGTFRYYDHFIHHSRMIKNADLKKLEYLEIYYLTENEEKIYSKFEIRPGYEEPKLVRQRFEGRGDTFSKDEYKIHNRIESIKAKL